jgi:hypothetical protein
VSEVDLGTVTADDFRAWVGSVWRLSPLDVGDGTGWEVPLVLAAVSEGPRGGRPFTVSFSGPAGSLVPQGMWRLSHPTAGEVDLFLGPVAVTGARADYEAVFN